MTDIYDVDEETFEDDNVRLLDNMIQALEGVGFDWFLYEGKNNYIHALYGKYCLAIQIDNMKKLVEVGKALAHVDPDYLPTIQIEEDNSLYGGNIIVYWPEVLVDGDGNVST